MRKALDALRRNKLPVISTALACLFTLMLWPFTQHFPLPLFIAAVLFCAWRAAARAALLATALSAATLFILLSLLPFPGSGNILDHAAPLGSFVLIGTLATFYSHRLGRMLSAVEQARAALSSSQDALIFTDEQARVASLNFAAASLTGWHPLNAVQQPLKLVLQLKHERTGQFIDDFPPGVPRRRESIDLPPDAMVVSSQGKQAPVEGSAVALVDSGGTTIGMMICLRDVAKRRQAENAARLREERACAEMSAASRISEERLLALQALQANQAQLDRKLEELEATRAKVEEVLRNAQEEHGRALAAANATHAEQVNSLRQAQRAAQDELARTVTQNKELEKALRQAEDAVRKAHEDLAGQAGVRQNQESLEKHLAEVTSQQKQLEEELRKIQEDRSRQIEERAAEQLQAEETLRRTREDLQRQFHDESALQGEQIGRLQTDLAGARATEAELRENQQRLQQAFDESQAKLIETRAGLEQQTEHLQQLKCLVENCEDGMFAFDRDCRFTTWNTAMERITGLARTNVIGRLAFEVFPALEETGESHYFLETLSGKRVRAQSSVLSVDGNRNRLDQTFVPYQTGPGEPQGGLVIARELPATHWGRNGKVSEEETTAGDDGESAVSTVNGADWLSFN